MADASETQISRVPSLRLAAWTLFALGIVYAGDRLSGYSPSWVDRVVDPQSGWGMVLTSVRALGHVLAAGVMAITLLTIRERWAWWLGIVAAFLFGIVDGAHFLFPGRDEDARMTWALQGLLGIALIVLLALPSSRGAFSGRSSSRTGPGKT